MGTQISGSVSIGASLGVEYNMTIDSESNQTYHGITGLVGIGASAIPAEFHGEVSNSWIWGINLYDAAIAFIEWLTPNE